MTSFTSLLSSIGGQPRAPQPSVASSKAKAETKSTEELSTPNIADPATRNLAIGVKRKYGAENVDVKSKATRMEPRGGPSSTSPPGGLNRSTTARTATSGPSDRLKLGASQRSQSSDPAKPASKASMSAPAKVVATSHSSNGGAPPAVKRGFASIMERAKAAQEAAKATGTSGITHKPMVKLTKHEKRRILQEAKQNPPKGDKVDAGSVMPDKTEKASYKGTARTPAPEIGYKGTMREIGPGDHRSMGAAKKNRGQSRQNEYANWSDIDDEEEDEEEGAYDSEDSEDMEGGFDDVEREEDLALRAARKEDQAALEEEERHKREKLERKRRLERMNQQAAAKRKF